VGTDPTLPCIFLNSHYDVVPVIEVKLKTMY
jgi:acetylornithine deacetylase/succinyl-diaminopimelate desuccinylase-like protein